MARDINLFCAPLQGYTESMWREAHRAVYGPQNGAADCYFTPFVRIDKGEVRRRDLRELPVATADVAQIIFRNREEFCRLIDAVSEAGCSEIDLNLGCPFPMQTGRGRGAAAVGRPELLAEVAKEMQLRKEIGWSAKMRLGLTDPKQWRSVAQILSEMPLRWLTVHPRVATQLYKGELWLDEMDEVMEIITHPIVFNGEIQTPASIDDAVRRWPGLSGVMIGRGLLARPSLIAEYRSGEEWSHEQRMESILALHKLVFEANSCRLEGGEHQLVQKMLAFWEYLEPEIGHKIFKAIKKSTSIRAYLSATGGTQI